MLCDEPPTRELEHDREQVYDALREGRCYIAVDSLAPARGFRFEADDLPMGAEAPAGRPHPARPHAAPTRALRLLRDGARDRRPPPARALDARGRGAGRLPRRGAAAPTGRERTWILSNPIYLR